MTAFLGDAVRAETTLATWVVNYLEPTHSPYMEGAVTEETFQMLRLFSFLFGVAAMTVAAAAQSGTCGAIAYASTGPYGAVWMESTCDEAKRKAIQLCQTRSKTDRERYDCTVGPVAGNDIWILAAQCSSNRGGYGTVIVTRLNERDLEAGLKSHTAIHDYIFGTCRTLVMFNTAGRHQQ